MTRACSLISPVELLMISRRETSFHFFNGFSKVVVVLSVFLISVELFFFF